jgi:hypothetical protein
MAKLFNKQALDAFKAGRFSEFSRLANLSPMARDALPRDLPSSRYPQNGSAEDPARVRAATNPPRGETQHQSFLRDSTSTNLGQHRPTGLASRDQTSGGEQQLRIVLEGLGLSPETVEQVLRAVANSGDQANNMVGAMPPPPATSEEPGTQAASTALKPNKYQSLMALLDALELEDEDEIDGEKIAPGEGGMMPRNGGGMTNGSGLITDGEALKALPMREASPTPVRLPAKDSMSFATGDAAIVERRRAVDRRLDRHLRDSGLRSEAHRAHALELARQKRARMALDAASDGFEDFSKFCPGAARIDVL